jgi:hypothetical protein
MRIKLLILLVALIGVIGALFMIGEKPSTKRPIVISCEILLEKEPILLPLECTEELGKDAGVAVLTITKDGMLDLMEEGRLIFANPIFDETPIAYIALDGSLIPNSIQFSDITNDGYKDIRLLMQLDSNEAGYEYYAYDPYTESYESRPLRGVGTQHMEIVDTEI